MTHEYPRRDDLTKEEVKDAMKDALKQWLDEKYAEFGKFTAGAIAVALFGAFVFLILWANGWHKG